MAERLGVGIVGATGFFGKDWYLDGFKHVPDAQVVAVSARDKAKLDALDTDATRYTDYHDLLANPHVDLVVVSTPDALHYEVVMAAAAAGKNVLCEKPLATNVKQAREMVAALRQANRLGFVNFTYRNMPSFQKVAELVRAGEIGPIQYARVDVSWGAGLTHRQGTPSWRLQAASAGVQGVLGDAGSHMFDMLRWTAGNPLQVTGQIRILEPDRFSGGVVDNADLCLIQGICESGASFTSNLSRVTDGPAKFLTVHLLGTNGTLEANVTSARLLRGGSVEELPITQLIQDTERQPEVLGARYVSMPAITRAVLYGEQVPWLATFEDGLRVQEAMDAVERAAHEQNWVDVDYR